MIPYAYQKMKTHVCRECGTVFESGSPNALYCTLTCQRTAKTKRRALRNVKHEQVVAQESKFFADVPNPSEIQLVKYAELVRDELTNGKPVRFTGTIPMWQPLDGILFIQQQGVEPVEWIMFHPAMIE